VTDPNVAAVGLTAKSVIFGDLSRYFIRQVGGIRMEQSNDFAFASDLVTFKAAWRADGALTDLTGAVKHFIGAAS
jgi:HK97 family phage major capsid protein